MEILKKSWFNIVFLLVMAMVFTMACETLLPQEPEENELLDGPMEGLSYEEERQFLEGDITFNDEIFTVKKGLGPIFVGNSCVSCHAGDGKGHPFNKFIRFGQSDSAGGNPFATVGDKRNQLQHKAIPGYEPEKLPDGAPYSEFLAPAVTGLGFLDAVPDADIIAMANANAQRTDDIRGRPHYNFVPDYVQKRPNSIPKNGMYIHRFGKKSITYDLLHQTVDAFNQDMGIVSFYDPIDPYSGLPEDPEISRKALNDMVFYLKTLKAPLPRNQNDPDVRAGKEIFVDISCAACHIPKLKTGFSEIEALSHKEFYPYTDLLLHDMGPELDDGYTEGHAHSYEWRTAPLWGLGLSTDSQGGEIYLMHDGRARSIDEAIRLHGGEAEESKNKYVQLSDTEREQILKFLESL